MTKWMPPLPDKYPGEVKQWMLDYAEQYRLAWIKAQRPHVKYGCHCDLDEGQKPDDCVLNINRPQDCVYAMRLVREGKDQSSCEYWKPIRLEGK